MERIPHQGRERKYVAGWNRDRVQNAAKAIEGLQEHPGWGELQELIDYRLDVEERRMVYGPKPLSHAEYAHAAGFIRGLRQLKTSAEQVLDQAREIDEENRRAAERQTAAKGA